MGESGLRSHPTIEQAPCPLPCSGESAAPPLSSPLPSPLPPSPRQGPDGGFSASKYCMIGGFDGTSNVIAGKLLPGVNVKGTHAHAFVQAFSRLSEVIPMSEESGLKTLLERVLRYRTELDFQETHDGELAAFVSYAHAFPDGFLALIDTYDSLSSGCRNFILVALALDDLGFTPRGIRLDSGDLAYISKCCRDLFTTYGEKMKRSFFSSCAIVASNDINESVLVALSKAEHCITSFGIGTNLVTCQKQPALGCVYKLCEINGQPRIKVRAARELAAAGGRRTSPLSSTRQDGSRRWRGRVRYPTRRSSWPRIGHTCTTTGCSTRRLWT